MGAWLEPEAAFLAPGWDALLEGVRRDIPWCTDRTVEWALSLPSYANFGEAALRPRVARSYAAVLAGVELRRRPLPADSSDRFVEEGADRARQGVEPADMAAAWRFGQGALYLRACAVVPEGPHRDQLLREFLELLISWVDFALLGAAEGHRQREISEVRRLLDEQAALRRVAVLVARGVSPSELFSAVSDEVSRLFDSDHTAIARIEGAEGVVVGASAGIRREAVGWRVTLEDPLLMAMVQRTGRPGRRRALPFGPIAAHLPEGRPIETVAAPIVVEERVWGVMIVWSQAELPSDAEHRLERFTELVATAIANVEARAEVRRLADEQAALRRIATLVAHEASQAEVFAAIGEECARSFGTEDIRMVRFEGVENTATIVFRTGRSARLDGMDPVAAAPIVVAGRLWGAMEIRSTGEVPLPADTESRLGQFTELMGTAIDNVQARSDLATSRARIVVAGDEERRRVVRDLHDGAQQRLVYTVVTLKHARRALEQGTRDAPALVGEALEHAQMATDELRELAHGILPSALTLGGLDAGIRALASRMTIPVDVDVSVGRLPEMTESTAYFIVAEALTNVAKHAHAHRVTVAASLVDGALHVEVNDDGLGGARPDGRGLVGLRDRLAALDGTLRIGSPEGGGTHLSASIPRVGPPGGSG